jgi:hypothetical protein
MIIAHSNISISYIEITFQRRLCPFEKMNLWFYSSMFLPSICTVTSAHDTMEKDGLIFTLRSAMCLPSICTITSTSAHLYPLLIIQDYESNTPSWPKLSSPILINFTHQLKHLILYLQYSSKKWFQVRWNLSFSNIDFTTLISRLRSSRLYCIGYKTVVESSKKL